MSPALPLGCSVLVQADPVRPIGLAVVVPLGIVTRRQAIDVGSDGRRALLVERFLVVAEFVEAPQVAVVVAIADLGIGEMDIGQLVALAAGAGDVGQSQFGDCFAAVDSPCAIVS
jgi:hypothetical protein